MPTPSKLKNRARAKNARISAANSALAAATRNDSGPTGRSATKPASRLETGAPGGCAMPSVRAAAMKVPSSYAPPCAEAQAR
jgi:hypothetical protein